MMGLATGFKSLLALRLALGVGEAAAYPSNAGIAARWFPDRERATVSGLFDSASKFGGAVAMPLIVWMIYQFDWRLTFLIIGSVGILWVIAWYFIYTENPEDHKNQPGGSETYSRGAKQKHGDKSVLPMRWYKLLRYRNIWAMCIGFSPSITLRISLLPVADLSGKRQRYGFYQNGYGRGPTIALRNGD